MPADIRGQGVVRYECCRAIAQSGRITGQQKVAIGGIDELWIRRDISYVATGGCSAKNTMVVVLQVDRRARQFESTFGILPEDIRKNARIGRHASATIKATSAIRYRRIAPHGIRSNERLADVVSDNVTGAIAQIGAVAADDVGSDI